MADQLDGNRPQPINTHENEDFFRGTSNAFFYSLARSVGPVFHDTNEETTTVLATVIQLIQLLTL